jgi:hypothetical protein
MRTEHLSNWKVEHWRYSDPLSELLLFLQGHAPWQLKYILYSVKVHDRKQFFIPREKQYNHSNVSRDRTARAACDVEQEPSAHNPPCAGHIVRRQVIIVHNNSKYFGLFELEEWPLNIPAPWSSVCLSVLKQLCKVLSRFWVWLETFESVAGFTGHLQNVTTNNYDSLTELHTPNITVTTTQ